MDALAPLFKELGKASGAKKGAITKHINRVIDALVSGGGARGGRDDRRQVDGKQLEKARRLGEGLLAEVLGRRSPATTSASSPHDLVLKPENRNKADWDTVVAWG